MSRFRKGSFLLPVALGTLLAGCTAPPLADDPAARLGAAPYPVLVPVEPLLAEAARRRITPETTAEIRNRSEAARSRAERVRSRAPAAGDLAARAERLRRRAAALRNSDPVSDSERDKLAQALARRAAR